MHQERQTDCVAGGDEVGLAVDVDDDVVGGLGGEEGEGCAEVWWKGLYLEL